MKKTLIIITVGLAVALAMAMRYINKVEEEWKREAANTKAYSSMLSASQDENTSLQLTVSQLKYFNDSVLVELDNARKELGIKDKNLKALQKISSDFRKVDTLVLRDTIFKEPAFALDTIFGDGWYNVELNMRYPSEVIITPEFRSEKYVVVSSKKETVNPPKKCFFLRWFQKKHIVTRVDIIERNPYVENQNARYVEIVK